MKITLRPALDNYAVIGSPIEHSKSPLIHGAFARQLRQRLYYQAIRVDVENFRRFVFEFRELGGKGLNVTLPLKGEAWKIADRKSRLAERAQAVNTLSFAAADGAIIGENTDGTGLARDLTVNNEIPVTGKAVLLLGAGGAVRGVLDVLFDEQPARMTIANRTFTRAQKLAGQFADRGEIEVCAFEALAGRRFDLVINGISSSLRGEPPPLPELKLDNACCYDMAYGDSETGFTAWARECGAAILLDGCGMLVEQAAEAFSIWRGARPDTAELIRSLKNRSQSL